MIEGAARIESHFDAATALPNEAELAKAAAAGFRNPGHLSQDCDRDVLRGREDFKTLIASLAEKGK